MVNSLCQPDWPWGERTLTDTLIIKNTNENSKDRLLYTHQCGECCKVNKIKSWGGCGQRSTHIPCKQVQALWSWTAKSPRTQCFYPWANKRGKFSHRTIRRPSQELTQAFGVDRKAGRILVSII